MKGGVFVTKQEKTFSEIETTMRKWITKQLPVYEQIDPAQINTSTQGEKVIKANPAAQEIRAAFKDYCYIVKTQKELSDGNADAEKDDKSIEYFRSKLRAVK